ncbi:hypothetical protein FACS1894186_0220 [Alphaproteobacteria bacterium]|nr:hypothetical protein FACS1894186_0220 [Alphaproteobacteria bacterium]
MAIVRMTSEEIRKAYPLTPERLAALRDLGEPDLTDPDAPDVVELEKQGLARRVGRPRKADPKRQITLRLPANVLAGLRKLGRGWQAKTGDILGEWLAAKGLL